MRMYVIGLGKRSNFGAGYDYKLELLDVGFGADPTIVRPDFWTRLEKSFCQMKVFFPKRFLKPNQKVALISLS